MPEALAKTKTKKKKTESLPDLEIWTNELLTSGKKHVAGIGRYCRAVISGERPACIHERRAVERFLRDLSRQETRNFPYAFDFRRVQKICNYLENLKHIKGKWARDNQYIKLEPWQQFNIGNIFGWVNAATGLRRFKSAYLEVPRKNAKSTILAGVGLYMLTEDGEPGAECYSAATTRDQAKIVFSVARSMAIKSPELRAHYELIVFSHNLHIEETDSKFEPLSAEGNSLDGLNVHFACLDELHAHKSRDVFEVLETATGSRDQPLLFSITTAGSNRSGICYEQRRYVIDILSGKTKDETYYGMIYTIDDDDYNSWDKPSAWVKANPNYGVSVNPDDMERLCTKARATLAAKNGFLTKRLNVWVNADSQWIDPYAWRKCGDPNLKLADFKNKECVIGLDLASKTDIAAKIKVFPEWIDDKLYVSVFGEYFLPLETVRTSDNSQYMGWAEQGLLLTSPGNVLNFNVVEESIKDDTNLFAVKEVAYDPWQATQLASSLSAQRIDVIEYRNTVANFSSPMKEIEALVKDGRLVHNGDPVLEWMISNVVCHVDAKENIYPRKEKPENKIDGVIALIMAIGRVIFAEPDKAPAAPAIVWV